MIAIPENQIIYIILALIVLIAIIIIVIEWRKSKQSTNNVLLLEKQAELKKIELVEKDLEDKRRKENLTEISEEDQQKLKEIRSNTTEMLAKAGLLNAEVNEKVDQLEAKSELLKLKKLSKELEKKEEEIDKSLEK